MKRSFNSLFRKAESRFSVLRDLADRLLGGIVTIFLVSSINAVSGQENIDPKGLPVERPSNEAATSRAPVLFRGDTLFSIQTEYGTLTAAERASIISSRIAKLAESDHISLDSLRITEHDELCEVFIGNERIMALSHNDTIDTGLARLDLAKRNAEIIVTAIRQHTRSVTLKSLLLGLAFALIATAGLVLLLKLIGYIDRRGSIFINNFSPHIEPFFTRATFGLISPNVVFQTVLQLWKLMRIASVLVVFYIYLSFVFSFFPYTQGFAKVLLTYLLSPLKVVFNAFIKFIPKLFFITVIVVLTRFLTNFVKKLFERLQDNVISFPGFFPEWAIPTYKIVRLLIILFAIIVVFPYLPGSSSPAFKGVSLFFGVLFSLGSTSAIANMVAGTVITYMRPFKLGDRVKISDTTGDVVEKTLLVTRIRTTKNVEITIPNSMVLGSHIINYSSTAQSGNLILNTSVTIGYDAPWRQVHELLIKAALASEGIQAEPKPFVLQTALNDFYVAYEINAYTDQPNKMAQIYSNLHQNIQDTFNKAGVEIMSSHYSAIRDGNQSTVPASFLPEDYQTPGFRVVKE